MLSWFSLSVSRGGAKKKLVAAKNLIMSPNHNICYGFILFFSFGTNEYMHAYMYVLKLFFNSHNKSIKYFTYEVGTVFVNQATFPL